MTAHVRENVEKKEHSSTAGGTEAGTTSLEFSVEIPQNIGNLKTQMYHSWAYTKKMSHHAPRHMFFYVHNSLVYYS